MSRITRKRFVSVGLSGAVTLVTVGDYPRCRKSRTDLGVVISAAEYATITDGPLAREFEEWVDADWRMDGVRFRRLVDEFMRRPDLRARSSRRAR